MYKKSKKKQSINLFLYFLYILSIFMFFIHIYPFLVIFGRSQFVSPSKTCAKTSKTGLKKCSKKSKKSNLISYLVSPSKTWAKTSKTWAKTSKTGLK
jgi:hypothetical protein